MSTGLIWPSSGRIAVISAGPTLPTIIADAGEKAAKRFVEFFTNNIRNPHTWKAYARAAGDFFARFEDRAHAIEVFNWHIEEVKRAVPKDRLLVYEVSEGWRPLCSFLGVPIPEDQPFPHLNDAAEFQARIRKVKRNLWIIAFLVRAVVLVVGWLASRLILQE